MPLALLFHYLMLDIFRILIHSSSRARDLFVELFHGLYCSVRIEVIALACLFSGECLFVTHIMTKLKLVSLYSTIKMMHGPMNIRFKYHSILFYQKHANEQQ